MSQEERFGTRCRAYSVWHRRNSTRRFVGLESAQLLAMIDIDAAVWVEYDDGTKEPLALIETAQDVGQAVKPSTVTQNLAKRCHPPLRAYTLLYTLSSKPSPSDPSCPDIESFRVRCIWPHPEHKWTLLTPEQWAQHLLRIRNSAVVSLDSPLVAAKS